MSRNLRDERPSRYLGKRLAVRAAGVNTLKWKFDALEEKQGHWSRTQWPR